MPYRISRTFIVESGHMLSLHPGACRFPHGHTRKVEVVLLADSLDARGMVCDFKALKQLVQPFVERFDHSMAVNTRDPQFAALRAAYGERIIPFEDQEPTTEAMAFCIFEHVKSVLAEAAERPSDPLYPIRRNLRVERVRVGETPSTWGEYFE